MTCTNCEAALAEAALSCDQCRRLVHADRLEDLTRRAKEAWRHGKFQEERSLWIEALGLLPTATVQYRTVDVRIAEIDGMLGTGKSSGEGWKKASMGIGPALLVLLGKGKFLLLGLTKLGTVLSIVASLGVYWALYGWALAAGIIVSIYIHEMGHVAELRRYGFPAGPPIFIPGFGAFIQLRGVPLPPIPESRIGLAGPIYGLGAALIALAVFLTTRIPIWGVIAHFTAWMNVFNLTPVWQLDGSRGMRSFTRSQRGVVLAAAACCWLLTSNPMFFLVSAGSVYRLFTRDWQSEPDRTGLLQFIGLLAGFAIVIALTAGSVVTKGR